MNTVLINMSSLSIENETTAEEEYGAEVMFSGWNPQIATAVEQPSTVFDKHVNFLAGLANADVDTFLQKMYEYQR